MLPVVVLALALPASPTLDAWRAQLGWPADCEAKAPPHVTPLGDGTDLLEVSCSFAAYQGESIFYLRVADGTVSAPLELVVYGQTPPDGDFAFTATIRVLGIAQVLPQRSPRAPHRLSVLQKSRGLGDCGVYSVYELPRDVRGTTKLVELRVKPACDERMIPVEQWAKKTIPRTPQPTASVLDRDPTAVRDAINAQLGPTFECFQVPDAASCPPVDLVFTIDPTGAVIDATATATAKPRDDALERCVLGKMRAWHFSRAAKPTSVAYPLHPYCIRQ